MGNINKFGQKLVDAINKEIETTTKSNEFKKGLKRARTIINGKTPNRLHKNFQFGEGLIFKYKRHIYKMYAVNLWTEDFIDEDTGEIVSIIRHKFGIIKLSGKPDLYIKFNSHMIIEAYKSGELEVLYNGTKVIIKK